MIGIGPLPVTAVWTMVCIGAALGGVAWLLRRQPSAQRRQGSNLAFSTLLVLLLAARAVYVLMHLDSYWVAPMSILRFGDGGLKLSGGIAAALIFAAWRTRRATGLRRPLVVALAGALALWWAGNWALNALQRSRIVLPDVALQTLDGEPVRLASHLGQPIVINLWASWCPPCRREMPALARAQLQNPDVAIVLVNQGEDATTVRRYLQRAGLDVDTVYLDPGMASMNAVGSRGLPTTLFFDAEGRFVRAHLGEITMPVLEEVLSDLR